MIGLNKIKGIVIFLVIFVVLFVFMIYVQILSLFENGVDFVVLYVCDGNVVFEMFKVYIVGVSMLIVGCYVVSDILFFFKFLFGFESG